jgi:hypothetical protein
MSRGFVRRLAPIAPPEERVLVIGECRQEQAGSGERLPDRECVRQELLEERKRRDVSCEARRRQDLFWRFDGY